MLKALVVDDDKIIRNNILQSLDWSSLGFELPEQARNGLEALKRIRLEKPDLVITDICMPGMDGVELIQSVKLEFPQIKFLVLSNYDDFHYVKSAMKHGALDYVLKYEIVGESLTALIKNVKQEIEAEQHKWKAGKALEQKLQKNRQNQFWTDMFEGMYAATEMERLANELNFRFKPLHGIFILAKSRTGRKVSFQSCLQEDIPAESREEQADTYIFDLKDDMAGVFLNYCHVVSECQILNRAKEQINRLLEQRPAEYSDCLFCLGDVLRSVEELPANAARCREMLEEAYYSSSLEVVTTAMYRPFRRDIQLSEYEPLINSMLQQLFAGNLQEALLATDQLTEKFRQERVDPKKVGVVLHYLVSEFSGILRSKKLDSFLGYPKAVLPLDLFDSAKDIEAVNKAIRELLANAERELFRVRLEAKDDDIHRAIDFIIRSHAKPIGLQEVADHIGFSKNHFCRRFKQETGENFLDYLNKVRIEHAKQLLAATERNVNDIAMEAGFNDCRYFKQIFFKYTGTFPTEFRKASS